MKTLRLTGFAAALLLSFDVYASMEEAKQAFKEKDFAFASVEFNRLATEENDAEAMYFLADMYEKGQGVMKNDAEALRLLQESAAGGFDKAALKLGNFYYSGKGGVEKNYPEAYKWFKAASDKNNFIAQYNLGLMIEEGIGGVVKQDPVKAFQYYLKSGNQGYYLAQNALGRMYVEGVGTTQNYTRGMGWYKLASDQGHVDSQMKLADLFANMNVKGLPFNLAFAHVYYNVVAAYAPSPMREQAISARDNLINKMQVKDIQAAQQYAQGWRKKTRLESYPPESFESLAVLDEEIVRKEQEVVKKEERKPVTVLTELEDILIETGVSRRTLYNAIEKNDFSKIVEKLNQQAENNELLPMVALGDLYMLGQGLELNVPQAMEWYKKAAGKGNAIAAFRLAPLYCQGNGVEKNMGECYKWFALSAKYADSNSRAITEQAVKMLEENLPPEQVAELKKQMEVYAAVPPESAGVISMFKEKFFGGSGDSSAGADGKAKAEKKTSEPSETQAPAKSSAPAEKPKDAADDIMDFPDL